MRRAAAVLGAIVLSSAAVRAHHSYAAFYQDRTVRIEGRLEQLHYGNPHVILQIRGRDAIAYTVIWEPATWAERFAGLTRSTFAVGDHLVVVAAPARDPASHELALVKEIQGAHGWRWRAAPVRARAPDGGQ